ncbi:MAG: hypothetical protein KIC78_10985 [Prevotella sp.]|uniref:DUF6864 domain-containing function n=1 Tax=Prevotella sp. TaxID=59823 RepID=UPI00257F669A|nr:hypothetical protein [Prevotella sp.]MBS5876679.1 hypothetical protein [Prevotella sp.]
MCRINTNPRFKLIKSEKTNISIGSAVSIIIEDTIEGNITFNITLLQDEKEKNVTRLQFIDEHTANVIIVNPSVTSNTMPIEPMEIGTYKKEYKLFMDYKLYRQYDGEDYRQINIEFGIAKK